MPTLLRFATRGTCRMQRQLLGAVLCPRGALMFPVPPPLPLGVWGWLLPAAPRQWSSSSALETGMVANTHTRFAGKALFL